MKQKKNLMQSFIDWIDERLPFTSFLKWGLEKEIIGGAKFAYVLGGITLFLFIILVLTGVLQAFYYVPSIDHAYDSVMFLRLKVPFGWLIHGLHYWAANAFVVVIGLHMMRVFIWGAYKKPRELIWLSGVVLMLLTAGFVYTGPILAWDKQGYWAGRVGIGIIETVPLIGDSLMYLIQGGSTMGQVTISRFFAWHVFILPAMTILLIIFHLIAFRQFGSVGPWNEVQRKISGRFWPDQIFKDVIALVLTLLVLIGLVVFAREPITGLADPLDSTISPKPAWPFLMFYVALKVFSGPWEIAATVGIPLLIITLLVLPPFVDRSQEQSPFRRLGIVISFLTFILLILILTVVGYYSHSRQELDSASMPPMGNKTVPSVNLEGLTGQKQEGEKLYTSLSCSTCHSIDASGIGIGPNLLNAGLDKIPQDQLIVHIKEPKKFNPATIMPAFTNLNQEQMDSLVYFLQNLKTIQPKTFPIPIKGHENTIPDLQRTQPGPAARMIGSAQHGQVIYQQFCTSCHNVDGKGGIPNPGSTLGVNPPLTGINPKLFDNDPDLFAEKIDLYLQYGSRPEELHSLLPMPSFGKSGSLTQEQIADVEAYVLDLNGIDRAKIINPGIQPRTFFKIVLATFGLISLIIIIIQVVKKPKD